MQVPSNSFLLELTHGTSTQPICSQVKEFRVTFKSEVKPQPTLPFLPHFTDEENRLTEMPKVSNGETKKGQKSKPIPQGGRKAAGRRREPAGGLAGKPFMGRQGGEDRGPQD